MTLRNRIRRWWYWHQVSKLERACAWDGHLDHPCWAESGALGDKCHRCGRILWTSWPGKREHEKPRYQEPSRLHESNWR